MEFLPYSEARSSINDGDLVFIRTKGKLHHRLIEWFTDSDIIHVGIVFWLDVYGSKHLMISEANGGAQRRIVNLSHYQDYNMDIIRTEIPWDGVRERALSRLGQVQYNWIGAGYVGLNDLFIKQFGVSLPKVRFPGEICSEFVANILDVPHTHLSPAGLYHHLINTKVGTLTCSIRPNRFRSH